MPLRKRRTQPSRSGQLTRAEGSPEPSAQPELPVLIASDVDGTLVDDDEVISQRTREAIAASVAAGSEFVLATGRPPRWVTPIVDMLGQNPLVVCANGSVIYDSNTDQVLSASLLSVEVLTELAEIAQKAVPGSGIAAERVGESAHDAATPMFVAAPGYEHAWLNPDHVDVSVDEVTSSPAIKMLVRMPGATSVDLKNLLEPLVGDLADVTFSTDNGLVEFMPVGISKAAGLQQVSRILSISDGPVVAFGDMPNDIEMLTWASRGVAMANAHPQVRAIANDVTATNNQDGVALVLERLLR